MDRQGMSAFEGKKQKLAPSVDALKCVTVEDGGELGYRRLPNDGGLQNLNSLDPGTDKPRLEKIFDRFQIG